MSDHKIYWSAEDVAVIRASEARGRRDAADLRLDLRHDLDQVPDSVFCGFGGLNPHLSQDGDYPACRVCARNDDCDKPFRVPGL